MQTRSRTSVLLQESPVHSTILVVDDDDVSRGVLIDLLRAKEYHVLEAANGQQALDIIGQQAEGISLVISDMIMPFYGGGEVLAAIRNKSPDIPVILMSAYASVDEAVKCMRMNAIGYLPKPIDSGKLFTLVREGIELHKKNKTCWRLAFANEQGPEGYIVEKLIGEGTYGDVFLVHKNGKRHAMKTIRTVGVSSHQQTISRQRFLHECKALKTLCHPNLISLYDYGLTGERKIPYMVTEYFPSDSWKNLQGRSLRIRTEILLQAAKGLQAIHQAGFCHRDIKPNNLFVNCATKEAKWGDFGFIRLPESTITVSGQTIGSPAYMAPEAFQSSRFDFRADIFSFGLLAYELLTGRPAFEEKNLPQLMDAVIHRHPAEPQSLNPNIIEALQKSLGRMLRKKPEDRQASMQEIISEWESCLEENHLRIPGKLSLAGRLMHFAMHNEKNGHENTNDSLPGWMS